MRRISTSAAALLFCMSWCVPLPAAAQAKSKAPKPAPQKTEPREDPLSALLRQAQEAIDKKDYAGALQPLQEYLAQRPDEAAAHFQLGYAYSELERWDDAKGEYARAIALDPKLAPAYTNLGLVLLDRDPVAAVPPLRQAAELLPDQWRPRYLLGLAFERSENLGAAIEEYRAAEHLNTQDYEIRFALGRALLRASRATEAETEFREALALRSDSAPARLGLANCLVAQKKHESAAAELAAYLAARPEDRDTRLLYASVLTDLGRLDQALSELRRSEAGAPRTLENYKLRAEILARQEQWPAASEALEKALALAPKDAELHGRLGRIRLEQRDFPVAERELRRALTIDASQTDALRDLISVYYLAENYPAALAAMDLLAKREGPTTGSWFVRATCYDKLGQKAEALAAYQKFVALDQGRSDKEDFQARQRIRLLTRELQQKKR